jgi:hypothetical protein
MVFHKENLKLRVILKAVVIFTLVTNSLQSFAGAISIQTSPFDFANGFGTIGWSFTVNQPVTISALGTYDAGGDGLINATNVGLWKADGTLITEAIVPAGTVGMLDGMFRFTAVNLVNLEQGVEYVVASFGSGLNDLASSFSTNISYESFGGAGSLDSRFNIISDRYSGTGNQFYTFPTLSDGDSGFGIYAWAGGNVQVVPLPQTLWLFLTGILGLFCKFRRNLFCSSLLAHGRRTSSW